jgi:hypothetical protein
MLNDQSGSVLGVSTVFSWAVLNEGPSELMRRHTWIMHVMKQGIHIITANVPKWAFSSVGVLYHRQ